MMKWSVQKEDYLTIYFENASSPRTAFKNSLLSSGMERNLAMQHRNKIELIWSAVSKELSIFPVHPLSNLHLLRDFYHLQTFSMTRKEDGVQESTLRSLYTSLGFFIQLRKYQVFAGMSRTHLQLLENCISDFNKDLNPYIKQRKGSVRKEKLKPLLLPSYFISYGRNQVIQNMLKIFPNYKRHPKDAK